MPTPEEIKKIVENFLDDWCTEHKEIIEPWHQIVEDLTNAISKDYCIVPKRHIQMRHASCCALAETDLARKDMYMCQKRVLESIFGKSLFEEEKL